MTQSQITPIGFIGLGAMGGGMANRLLQAGQRVLVFDLNPQRVAALVETGASAGTDIAQIAATCPVVITSLPSPEVFVQVAQTVLANTQPNHVLIDLGTSSVAKTRELAKAFLDRGAFLMDAPVSGGAKGAAQGKLRIFVGGNESIFQQCRPLLEYLAESTQVNYCGASGAGQIVKAVNQLAMGLGAAAYLEAIVLGVRSGIDPAFIAHAVGGGNESWRQHFASLAGSIARGQGESIGVKAGQLELFLELARDQGIDLPMTEALHAFCRDGEKIVMEANRPSASFWRELMGSTDH